MIPDICVIVPTIREYECVRAYVENARTHGFDPDRLFFCLVTEDHCETDAMEAMLDDCGVAGRVFDGGARTAWFDSQGIGEYRDLIPARSHAQTSFGLLYLWANEFGYGVFLDDDTRPHEDVDFFGTHLSNLAREGQTVERRSDERWVNVLDDAGERYPRGYPYGAMDETTRSREIEVESGDVAVSQGLWTGVPDLDAVRVLNEGGLRGRAGHVDRTGYPEDFVVAPGHFLTVCSMNLAFRREVIPAFYQFPMDDNEWGVGRFDDIWSGVVLKKACDVAGAQVHSGRPLCEHDKAPRSTFDDLTDEAAGLELNEGFWKVVDRAVPKGPPNERAVTEEPRASVEPSPPRNGRTDAYAAVARAVADELAAGEFSAHANGDFLNYCGDHLHEWLDCLDALKPAPMATPHTEFRQV